MYDMSKKEYTLQGIYEDMVSTQKADILRSKTDDVKVYYKTKLTPIIDYALAYQYHSYDDDFNPIDEITVMGIREGSQTLIYGKESSSKSTMAMQIAGNIARSFPLSQVYIFDTERSWSLQRAMELGRFDIRDIDNHKLVIEDTKTTLEDFQDLMSTIYDYKRKHRDIFTYTSEIKDFKGNYIQTLQPTIVLLDSIASLTERVNYDTKAGEKAMTEIESQPDKTRFAGKITTVWKKILPWQEETNIILVSINQDKTKIGMDGPMFQGAEIMGMKQNSTTPGGRMPRFLANIQIETSASGKFKEEEDGFNGFGVKVNVVKNRNNLGAGKVIPLINDPKGGGISYVRSSLAFCKENGLLIGNKNKMRFVNDPEKNYFSMMNAPTDFRLNRKLYTIMHSEMKPLLETMFLKKDETFAVEEEGEY